MQDFKDGIKSEGLVPEELNYRDELRMRQIPFHPGSAGTIKYQRVSMCGHKLILNREPKHRNCESCWFTFFSLHKELVESCDGVFKQFGENGLRKIRGPKFASNYVKFMATLAQWKKAADSAKEKDVEGITGTTGNSGDGGDSQGTAAEVQQDLGL